MIEMGKTISIILFIYPLICAMMSLSTHERMFFMTKKIVRTIVGILLV